ncbi:MAG: zinc ribbon domain-containing protein [Firmicutes bacterium]|nr:zinc ribbon domain-containing protein [Bacillota bacterium]
MDKFNMAAQMETSRELTRSPHMNKVIELADKVLKGEGNKSNLQAALQELEQAISQLYKIYQYEARFQEKTDFFKKESEIIEKYFKRAKDGAARIGKYFAIPENRYIEEGLADSTKAFIELFSSFDRLQEEESKRPQLSKSPYLSEIMRVAKLVKESKLSADLLKERLEMFIAVQTNFVNNIDYMIPAMDERLFYEENKQQLKDKFNELIQGLNLAKTYFLTHQFQVVTDGLAKADKAIEFIVEFEKKLKDIREAPKVKFCFKCGAENPRTVKFCVRCNFNFPPLQMEEESTLDVRLEEGGIAQTDHVMTENLMRLFNAVDGIKNGKITMDKYVKEVQWFIGIIEKAREEQRKIPAPPAEQYDPDAEEAFEMFKEAFETGMQDIEDGANLLLLYPENLNPDLLETGMETVMRGGDRLFQIKIVSEQAKAAMAQHMKDNK